MTAGELAPFREKEVVVSEITALILDKSEPEYTKELRE
jgi:hypothetical protein